MRKKHLSNDEKSLLLLVSMICRLLKMLGYSDSFLNAYEADDYDTYQRIKYEIRSSKTSSNPAININQLVLQFMINLFEEINFENCKPLEKSFNRLKANVSSYDYIDPKAFATLIITIRPNSISLLGNQKEKFYSLLEKIGYKSTAKTLKDVNS